MITPNIYLSEVPTLKLHVNLSHNHHYWRVTLLQRLTATILQMKLFPKRNLTTLEAVNTTYIPIPIPITQRYTDTEVCKIFFEPLFCVSVLLFILSFAHTSFTSFLFSFLGHIQNYQERQQSQIHSTKKQQTN